MRIDIWSDIMCPFCYIGKRRLYAALEQLKLKNQVTIVWHSFLLNPHLKTQPEKNLAEHLAQEKGWTPQQTQQLLKNVMTMGESVNIAFQFDKAVVANSRKAHQYIHLAQEQGQGSAMKDALLKAYFEEGANIDDSEILHGIAEKIGLSLASNHADAERFDTKVTEDLRMAQEIGIRGVPFFIFDNALALSGAQEVATFVESIQKAALKTTNTKQ
ncbi:MAG: DsbA family oxidoreductase [Schleiferiaceae bacterium]|nr:DsbA family oxidoreductase [Schleiferiaceae bacterium]